MFLSFKIFCLYFQKFVCFFWDNENKAPKCEKMEKCPPLVDRWKKNHLLFTGTMNLIHGPWYIEVENIQHVPQWFMRLRCFRYIESRITSTSYFDIAYGFIGWNSHWISIFISSLERLYSSVCLWHVKTR